MLVSSLLFLGANASPGEWQTLIFFGRLLAGISHGITYVTIFVHASENASKEFRHYLTTFIGATISLSIFLSTFLIYIPLPSKDKWVAKHSELQSTYVIMGTSAIFAVVAIVVNYFYSHETFAFLFANNYDDEALATVAKLNDEDLLSPKLKTDVGGLKEMCNNDSSEYGRWSLFAKSHTIFMAFAMYARFAAVLSFNIFVVVFAVVFVERFLIRKIFKDLITNMGDLVEDDEEKLKSDVRILQVDISLFKYAVRFVICVWFVCGCAMTSIGSVFVWRRSIHGTTFIAGLLLLIASLLCIFDINPLNFTGYIFLMLKIYFLFKSMPVDIIGYMYISDCFPITTKSHAIATVAIFENLINILVIAINLNREMTSHSAISLLEMFFYGLLLTTFGFKLLRTAPETRGLSLGEAQQAFIQAMVGRKWWKL